MELDQFCILAKNQRGLGLAALIQKAISTKNLYVFGELLALPSVQSLKETEEFSKHIATLELFAYGNYLDYLNYKSQYLDLSEYQERKLKLLTLASLGAHYKTIPYNVLRESLQVQEMRQLEDLIIEAIYSGLVDGKMNQRKEEFHVKAWFQRDVKVEDIKYIYDSIQEWKERCTHVKETIHNSTSDIETARMNKTSEMNQLNKSMSQLKEKLNLRIV